MNKKDLIEKHVSMKNACWFCRQPLSYKLTTTYKKKNKVIEIHVDCLTRLQRVNGRKTYRVNGSISQ